MSVEQARQHSARHVPIMAGCGANSTAEAIELARYAKKVGADCQLQVVPYYNKPAQEGLYRHFKAIAEAVADLPMVLYNVPGRTVGDLLHDTVLRLVGSPNLASKSWVTDQYDRYVLGNTVLAQPEDAGIIRVDERTGRGVAIATDGNGRFTKLDPRAGCQWPS